MICPNCKGKVIVASTSIQKVNILFQFECVDCGYSSPMIRQKTYDVNIKEAYKGWKESL